ncbi:MAG: DNA polymerase III subunit delta [Deltaproteobacteria bacterium]|nr:DNA polymerase III subunit delta [Candidatus Zymogenaceae bacterium]
MADNAPRLFGSLLELEKELTGGILHPVYFFYGDNEYQIEAAERETAERVVPGGVKGDDFSCSVFWAGDDQTDEVLGAAMTPSMLGGKRLVLLRHAERLTEKDAQRLAAYAENPPGAAVLIVTARGVGSGTLRPKTPAPPGRLKGLALAAATLPCSTPREGEIKNLIRKRLSADGKEIDPEALAVMVDFIGQDMTAVMKEIEKLLLFLGDRRRIETSDVEEMIPHLKAHSIFELTDALSGGDAGGAVSIIRDMMVSGAQPVQMLPMIRWHFMRLWRMKSLLEQGRSVSEAAQAAKIVGFRAKEYAAQVKRIPHAAFHNVFRELYRTDVQLKSRSGKGGVVLDRMVLSITTNRR